MKIPSYGNSGRPLPHVSASDVSISSHAKRAFCLEYVAAVAIISLGSSLLGFYLANHCLNSRRLNHGTRGALFANEQIVSNIIYGIDSNVYRVHLRHLLPCTILLEYHLSRKTGVRISRQHSASNERHHSGLTRTPESLLVWYMQLLNGLALCWVIWHSYQLRGLSCRPQCAMVAVFLLPFT